MTQGQTKYCLDANALMEPWNKYWTIKRAPGLWEIIDSLAKEGTVFCPDQVRREIDKVDDGLKAWIRARPHIVREETVPVQDNVRKILAKFPNLISVGANRSMADPWVIAHAMHEKATVVTKEYIVGSSTKPSRVKIPDVCDHFGIRWITDFDFIDEIGVEFSASRPRGL